MGGDELQRLPPGPWEPAAEVRRIESMVKIFDPLELAALLFWMSWAAVQGTELRCISMMEAAAMAAEQAAESLAFVIRRPSPHGDNDDM